MSDRRFGLLPAHVKNIGGLTLRVLRASHPAGRRAMLYTALGLTCRPLDRWWMRAENQLLKQAGHPKRPILFVCGAARSGTTLAAQVLIRSLPLAYFDNLSSLFPRAPITADRRLGWLKRAGQHRVSFSSLYGRTTHLYEPNDGLYFWQPWVGENHEQIPTEIPLQARMAMRQFFAAYEAYRGRPVLQKHNSLVLFAHLIAEVLPTARFVAMKREPIPHALSLLRARQFIHGDAHIPYGAGGPETTHSGLDPVESACRQVLFHQQNLRTQVERLGDRFLVVPYESFCAEPARWIQRIGGQFLGEGAHLNQLNGELGAFPVSSVRPSEAQLAQRVETMWERLNE